MRRPAAILTALIIAVVVVTGTYGVGARPSDTRSDRDQVRSERATVASNLDALRASQAELNAALRVLEENVRVEQGRLDDAQQAVAAAEAQVAAAQRGHRDRRPTGSASCATTMRAGGDRGLRPAARRRPCPRCSSPSPPPTRPSARRSRACAPTATPTSPTRSAPPRPSCRPAAASPRPPRSGPSASGPRWPSGSTRSRPPRRSSRSLMGKVKTRIQGQLARAADLQAKDQRAVEQALPRAAPARRAAGRAARRRRASPGLQRRRPGGRRSRRRFGSRPDRRQRAAVHGRRHHRQLPDRGLAQLDAERRPRRRRLPLGRRLARPGGADRPPPRALRLEPLRHLRDVAVGLLTRRPPVRGSRCTRSGWPSTSRTAAAAARLLPLAQRPTPAGYGFINLPSEPWHWSVNGQ